MTWREILKEVRNEAEREAAQEPVIHDPMETSRKRERPGPMPPSPPRKISIGGTKQTDDEEETQ